MATGAIISQDIQEIKRPPDPVVPAASGSRPGNGNYPDIVDNENCFQPVNSDSCTNINNVNMSSQTTVESQVSISDIDVSRNNAVVEEQRSNLPSRGTVESSVSGVNVQSSSNPRTASVPAGEISPSGYSATTGSGLPNRPTGQVRQQSPTRGVRTATTASNQINTRELNTGITSRIDAQRTHNALPDILYSHQVPSSSPPRPSPHRPPTRYTDHRQARQAENLRRNHHRHRHREHNRSNRHSRSSRARSQSTSSHSNSICKDPCCRCLATVTSFRWVLVILSLLGVCCVVTGIILAALHATGNSFLILAIMFIGLGVLLVIVVGVGWKCTPRGHEPLHALFGLGEFRRLRETRRPRGHRRNRGDANWYGGVIYPEFQHRRPPPSYAVSMQDYQHQILRAQQNESHNNNGLDDLSLPSSPPPSYRSRASNVRQSAHITFPPSRDHAPDSHPPSYRSNISTSGHQRPPLPMSTADAQSYGDRQVADVAFTGPESVDVDLTSLPREDYSNSSESECDSSVAHNTSASSEFDRRAHDGSLPTNTNSAEVAQNSTDDNILDPAVQETLKSFDDITASAGITDDDNENTQF